MSNKMQETGVKLFEHITEGYGKIESGVVGGYQKVEAGVVDGFNKIADSFVGKYLTKDGETPEEARSRMAQAQKDREEKHRADAEKRAADQKARIEASLEASRNAGKRR